MANWTHPLQTDLYTDVLGYLNGKDVDAITLQKNLPSNMPDGAMAYDRGTDLFKEWNASGSAFVTKKLSVVGGGTGADNPTQARSNLGLGSMATQDSSAVSISGGSISGVSLSASAITSGVLALSIGGTGASLALGSSGSFLQSNGSGVVFGADGSSLTGLNASNITSGTIPVARLPTGVGTLVQYKYNITTATLGPVPSGFTTIPGFAITITPKSNSNFIKISVSFAVFYSGNIGINTFLDIKLKRNGAVIANFFRMAGSAFTNVATSTVAIDYVDSPATTSATTYQFEANNSTNSSSSFIGINVDSNPVLIDAAEIIP